MLSWHCKWYWRYCLVLQVQRLVLGSFLGRQWEQQQSQNLLEVREREHPATQLGSVPPVFVLQVLLPAAGQVHMWRGEGAAGLQHQTAAWVGCYAAAQRQQEQRQQLLLSLLQQLEGSQLQRPLAQTLAAALMAAADAVGDQEEQAWQLLFLQHLQQATRSLSSSWGSGGSTGSYATSICSSLVQAAAAAVPALSSAPLLAAGGAWLQQLPLPLLLPGGALHQAATGWVQAVGRQQQVPLLTSGVCSYIAHPDVLGSSTHGSTSALASVDAAATASAAAAAAVAEWNCWQQQAGSLARLALLSASSGGGVAATAQLASSADLGTAFASWTDTLGMLYRR
jgi:hypothetical protein